jgi:hypothetical protein
MDESQRKERLNDQAPETPAYPMSPESGVSGSSVVPAQCPACGGAAAQTARPAPQVLARPWVYAVGNVRAVSPNLSVEKELLRRMNGKDFEGLAPKDALQLALTQNNYLARRQCYVMSTEGVESYILVPEVESLYAMLIDATRHEYSAVVGWVGPVAPPAVCDGLIVPVATVATIYSFDRQQFIGTIPIPAGADPARFQALAGGLWEMLIDLSGGGQGFQRATVYIAMSDAAFYDLAFAESNLNSHLTAFNVNPTGSIGGRSLVAATATFTSSSLLDKTYARDFDLSNEFVVPIGNWRPTIAKNAS